PVGIGVTRDACPVERPRRTRRELLKMLPLASAALLLNPTWRRDAIEGGLALSHVASATVFNGSHLAPVFADDAVTPFEHYPLNSYLTHDPEVDLEDWRLEVSGLVHTHGRYTIDDIRAVPRRRQNTRHI